MQRRAEREWPMRKVNRQLEAGVAKQRRGLMKEGVSHRVIY